MKVGFSWEMYGRSALWWEEWMSRWMDERLSDGLTDRD